MDRGFRLEELRRFDGREGRPAYVAVDGRVYDVSASRLWTSGAHMRRHAAGRDLSSEIQAAPHGREVLQRDEILLVGDLVEAHSRDEHIPTFLSAILERFPILRRHPHPMMVHFPTAYLLAAAPFALLAFFGPEKWAVLEQVAFAMLVLGALFTPPSILTGILTWWVNYRARMLPQVRRKIQLAVLLAFMEIACLSLKLAGMTEGGVTATVYMAGMIGFVPVVSLMGYYGGHLTMPYQKRPSRKRP